MYIPYVFVIEIHLWFEYPNIRTYVRMYVFVTYIRTYVSLRKTTKVMSFWILAHV